MAEYTLQQDLDFALALADKVDAFTLARYGANDLKVETKPDMTRSPTPTAAPSS